MSKGKLAAMPVPEEVAEVNLDAVPAKGKKKAGKASKPKPPTLDETVSLIESYQKNPTPEGKKATQENIKKFLDSQKVNPKASKSLKDRYSDEQLTRKEWSDSADTMESDLKALEKDLTKMLTPQTKNLDSFYQKLSEYRLFKQEYSALLEAYPDYERKPKSSKKPTD